MIATITLNPSIDQHILVDGLVKDDANRSKEIWREAGGKGTNVSKVVKELGGRTHSFAVTGGLTGKLWESLLKKQRIALSLVSVREETRTNLVLTDLKDRTQTRISAPGPRVGPAALRRLVPQLLGLRPRPFLWVLGGSLPRGLAPGTYGDIIRLLRKHGQRCVLDTDNRALKLGIAAKPFLIKPNEHEMRRLVGRSLARTGDYLASARTLLRKGVRVVVVSLGGKGAFFVTPDEAFMAVAPKVPVRSKVGAGDSLIGGLVLGLQRGLPLKEAARWGIAASSSAVMTEGTRLCRGSDVSKLLSRVRFRFF